MRADLCALELGRMLLGRQHGAVSWKRFTSQGLLVKSRKIESSIMAHGLRIFIRHVGLWWSGSCGVVVEWARGMWWRGVLLGGCMHLSMAHVLSSLLVHMQSSVSFV